MFSSSEVYHIKVFLETSGVIKYFIGTVRATFNISNISKHDGKKQKTNIISIGGGGYDFRNISHLMMTVKTMHGCHHVLICLL